MDSNALVAFATAMFSILNPVVRRCGAPKFTPADERAAAKAVPGKREYDDKIYPMQTEQGRASSDEDNVSWFAPLGKFNLACKQKQIRVHSRDNAAMCRTPGAHRGMLKAAEILAAGTLELMLNGSLLNKARTEFKENMRGKKYKLPRRSSGPR